MTTDKGFKGCFILVVDEGCQQLPIRPACSILLQHDPVKMPNYRVHLAVAINSGISTSTFNIAVVPKGSLALPFDW